MSNWKYILILVSIHKSRIVYFEKICCADRSWKFIFFLVMEKSWKIIVEKEWLPCLHTYCLLVQDWCWILSGFGWQCLHWRCRMDMHQGSVTLRLCTRSWSQSTWRGSCVSGVGPTQNHTVPVTYVIHLWVLYGDHTLCFIKKMWQYICDHKTMVPC